MRDITNATVLWIKAVLLLSAGCLATLLLIAERPDVKSAFLLFVAIWSFARCYYFAFYVITHYVDATYKFSGLTSLALYLARRRRNP